MTDLFQMAGMLELLHSNASKKAAGERELDLMAARKIPEQSEKDIVRLCIVFFEIAINLGTF